MRFLYPQILLLFIPLVFLGVYLFYGVYRQRRALKTLGDTPLVKALMPDLSLKRKMFKNLLLLFSLTFLLLASARPQKGSKETKIKKEGIEVMVCLDVSNSMLSDDVSPSRLVQARNIISRMVDKLRDDRVGLIFFAGDAFVQMPITSDFISAKMFLSSANPSLIEAQGTSIGKAVNLALRSFSSAENVKRAIVLITDGETHDDSAQKIIRDASDSGVQFNVISIGTEKGGPIPLDSKGGYLLDQEGRMVITKVNGEMCAQIASAGKGIYIHAENVSNAVNALVRNLDTLEKSEMEGVAYSEYDEKYHYFLIIAILLIIVEAVLLGRKNRYLQKVKLFGDETI